MSRKQVVSLGGISSMARQLNKALVEKIILRIRKLREQNRVTLQEFYDETGIHLARIESERRDIPISTLEKICKYFGLSLSEFFKGI